MDSGAPGGLSLTEGLYLDFTPELATEAELVATLKRTDEAVADWCFSELVTRGKPGIQALLNFASTVNASDVFPGLSPSAEWCSVLGEADEVNGVLTERYDSSIRRALYGIDAILADTAPSLWKHPYRW